MPRPEAPSIIGKVERKRFKARERERSGEAARPLVKQSREIIERLFEGRELFFSGRGDTFSLHDNSERRRLLEVEVSTEGEPIEIEIKKIGREEFDRGYPRSHLEIPPFQYRLIVGELSTVASFGEDGLGLVSKGGKQGPMSHSRASRYLDLLRHIEAGIQTGTVTIKNPFLPAPTAEPVKV